MHLPADEKLAVLRAADHDRQWNSLDDKRVCFLCERTMTGRQIEVIRTATEKYILRCPTAGCNSTPHEWVYPGNPYTSEASWHDWKRVMKDEPAEELLLPGWL
jgi:hypothetical protein